MYGIASAKNIHRGNDPLLTHFPFLLFQSGRSKSRLFNPSSSSDDAASLLAMASSLGAGGGGGGGSGGVATLVSETNLSGICFPLIINSTAAGRTFVLHTFLVC